MQSTHKAPFFEKLEDRQLLSSCASTGLNKCPPTPMAATATVRAIPQAKVSKKAIKKAVPPAKNLLFFGNSFTLYNNVPEAIAQIAEAAGNLRPNIFSQTTVGWTLHDHLNQIATDGSNNIIQRSLPAGATWDDVVIQEFSTRPLNVTAAPASGDVAGFRADARTLFNLVYANSNTVKEVITETWARGADNPMYPAAYATPSNMQNDLLNNYTAASNEINGAYGAGSSTLAKAGEAWRAYNFDPTLYSGADEYHASTSGSLLEALTVFKSIYHTKAINVSAYKMTNLLSAYALSPKAFKRLALLADKVG